MIAKFPPYSEVTTFFLLVVWMDSLNEILDILGDRIRGNVLWDIDFRNFDLREMEKWESGFCYVIVYLLFSFFFSEKIVIEAVEQYSELLRIAFEIKSVL